MHVRMLFGSQHFNQTPLLSTWLAHKKLVVPFHFNLEYVWAYHGAVIWGNDASYVS